MAGVSKDNSQNISAFTSNKENRNIVVHRAVFIETPNVSCGGFHSTVHCETNLAVPEIESCRLKIGEGLTDNLHDQVFKPAGIDVHVRPLLGVYTLRPFIGNSQSPADNRAAVCVRRVKEQLASLQSVLTFNTAGDVFADGSGQPQ